MAKFSIDGSWVGKVMYDASYPAEYQTKELSFRINISSDRNRITGDCEDDVTRELLLRPATIEGVYDDQHIHFVKRYSCLVILGENNTLRAVPTEKSVAIQYMGTRYSKLFSTKKYFKGNWNISGSFINEKGVAQTYTVGGKWIMEKTD